MACIDPMMKLLNKSGYNMVRVPREGILPMDLLGRQHGRFEREGALRYLVTDPPEVFPPISPDQRTASLEGTRTDGLKVGLGVNILETLLKAMGGAIGGHADFDWARRMTFEFADVYSNTVDVMAVGHSLSGATVDRGNLVLKRYVEGVGKLYMITETLKSNSLVVEFESRTSAGGGATLPVIKEAVSGDLEIRGEAGRERAIRFQGETALVFAFRAHEVVVEDGELALQHARGPLVLAAGEGGAGPDPSLLAEADFLDMGDGAAGPSSGIA